MPLLPEPSISVSVCALSTGKLYLPERWLFEDGDDDMHKFRELSLDFSFLISHPSGKNLLFDLGMRKELGNNPEVIRNDYSFIEPEVPRDAVDILDTGPVSATNIDAIIFSHLHFDHTGDCTKFLSAAIIVGPGSHAATSPGFPKAPKSPFLSSILDHPGFRELSFSADIWKPLEPFSRAHDYFGDGSFYVLDAPGHNAWTPWRAGTHRPK